MIQYKTIAPILNGEVECSPEDYEQAVRDAICCVDLLVEIAKSVNDPSNESTFVRERIRKTLNKALRGSKENYIYEGW